MIISNNSIFDPITNSEYEMVMRAGIRKKQACLYLRAYIIIRLLFSREFVITDSSINLNRALRNLILREDSQETYDFRRVPDADFKQLIEDGTIRLAARDDHKGRLSEGLRKAQSSKKHVDLPSEEYTDLIDGICKEENVYWWNAEEVTKMFTQKIREGFECQFSDEINTFLRNLSYRLRDQETLTYDSVKDEALKECSQTSEKFQILRTLLRDAYDYNIPDVLNMEYFKFFEHPSILVKKSNLKIDKVEEYDIPWPYGFNLYAFAWLPANWLKDFWQSSQYLRYEERMSQYRKGMISFGLVLDALEDYLRFIDRHITPLYNSSKYVVGKPKNIIVRFQEYKDGKHPVIVATEMAVWGKNLIDTSLDLFSEPTVNNFIKLALTVMLPNIIFKGYEHFTALPKIKHGIIKLDK